MRIPRDDFECMMEIARGSGTRLTARGVLAGVTNFRSTEMRWLRDPDIVGYGIGLRRTCRKTELEPCFSVLVRTKQPRSRLDNPIPEFVSPPGVERAIPVDVLAVGTLRRQSGPGLGIRSAEAGGSNFGTFGCVLRSASQPERRFVLSNAHVLAPPGGTVPGTPIYWSDDRFPGEVRIGKLTSFIRKKFGAGEWNLVDCAVAELDPGIQIDENLFLQPTGTGNYMPPGTKVHIRGAKSGASSSEIALDKADIEVTVEDANRRETKVAYRDQMICFDFTEPGDSGSVVVNNRGRAIGLHFVGGAPGREHDIDGDISVFNRFTNVMDALRRRIPDLELEKFEGVLDLRDHEPARNLMPETASVPATPTSLRFVGRPPVGNLDDAISILARTLWGEARGEKDEGVYAVAEVIRNRAIQQKRRFGKTIEEVCQRPSHFSCWNAGDPNLRKMLAVTESDPRFAFCMTVSRTLVDGRATSQTEGADHYHTVNVLPSWAKDNGAQRKTCAKIGNHVFYNNIP